MARPWDADVSIDAGFARNRITAQFPEFSGVSIEPIGEGFDNAAFLMGGRTVFRLPRRAFAVPFLENETRILPQLVQHLPLRVPAPSHVGRPDEEYPYPFAGYPFIAGTTACRFSWTDAQRVAAAPLLGAFLRALHSVPVENARDWAPRDEIRRADLKHRLGQIVAKAKVVPEAAEVLALATSLAESPPSERLTWVHGDMHPRHLLVDEEGRPAAVIDWGDSHLGDPALDLSIAFTFLPPSGRAAFLDAYGDVDTAAWDRARFRALFYGPVLIEYGRDVGDFAMEGAGLTAIRFALAEE